MLSWSPKEYAYWCAFYQLRAKRQAEAQRRARAKAKLKQTKTGKF